MRFATFIVCIVLIFIFAVPCSSAEEYHSIADLREQTPVMWSATYSTDHGDSVSVLCPIVVPAVDSVPIIQVKPMEARSSEVETQYTAGAVYASYLKAYTDAGKHCLAFENSPGVFYYGQHGFDEYLNNYFWTQKYDYLSEPLFFDKADLHAIYPEDSNTSLAEAIAYYQKWITTFFPDEHVNMRFSPVRTSTYRSAYFDIRDNHQITPCGYYDLSFDQIIQGIPVLLRYTQTFNQAIKSKAETTLSLCNGSGALSLAEPDVEFGIYANLCQEVKITEADVPLIGFDSVQYLLENEIRSGTLTDVTRVELGYCVYADETNSDYCWLVPAWVCLCTYDAKENVLLVIPGQHAALNYNPTSKDPKRSICPAIVKWDTITKGR